MERERERWEKKANNVVCHCFSRRQLTKIWSGETISVSPNLWAVLDQPWTMNWFCRGAKYPTPGTACGDGTCRGFAAHVDTKMSNCLFLLFVFARARTDLWLQLAPSDTVRLSVYTDTSKKIHSAEHDATMYACSCTSSTSGNTLFPRDQNC
jgi:hypothetical protein